MARSAPPAEEAARLFQALSDPTRLQILGRLRHGEQCVCDLMDILDAAQSRLSFHLKVLKESGLVTDRREGRWMYYAISPVGFGVLDQYLQQLAPRKLLPLLESGARCA